MKWIRLVATLIGFFYANVHLYGENELKVGDGETTMKAVLGEPTGLITLRDKTLFLYPQGEVTIKDKTVTSIDLLDAKEFADYQENLKTERENWQKQQEAAALKRLEMGKALKADRRQSSLFNALPAKERIEFWRRFQANYPEIEVSEILSQAIKSYQQEISELKTQQQIAELKAQVAEAEKAATQAKLETEKLKKEVEESRKYSLRYYTTPRQHPYYYRPPTVIIAPNGNRTYSVHGTTRSKPKPQYISTLP